ncbi:hypothetical protein [Blastococcus goldschmidtiae]|uniref:Uncharacterized protein n=1 Tax=Blastococcus goldschmidtiae TaxID=3075546 RepID=A0ABU2K349_9ACTN|nr:hypothetical protein [Blastococcus sp. DSM 46792]MDT0274607.1 hypothetical protein [Blastococcus sp. DSM 46792]
MDIEQRLRIGLADRASDIDAAPGILDSVLAGHRRQNRRRAGLLAAGVCAAVAAVAIPLVTVATESGSTGGGSDRTAELAAYEPYPFGPRGNLADDAAYVDGLLTRDWFASPEFPEPPQDTRQVLFAAEVPGGIQALVTGWLDGARVGQWLHGPAGTAPAELEPSNEPYPVADDEPLSFTRTQDGVGALIVLARPGDTIEVSPRQDITADGFIVQAPYEVVGDADGVAVVDAAGLNLMTSALRITRGGVVVSEGPAGGGSSGGGRTGFDPSTALAGAVGEVDADLVRLLVEGVLDELGLTADQVTADVLWGGPIGNGNRPDVAAAVLTVQLPSGAVVAVGGYSDTQQPNGADVLTGGGACLRQVLPAGTEVTSVAMRCDLYSLEDGANLGSQLVVVPPAGTTQLRLVGVSGSVLDTRPVDGPAWVGPAPDGLGSVVALEAGGGVLEEIALGAVEQLRD